MNISIIAIFIITIVGTFVEGAREPPRLTVSRDREDTRRNAGDTIEFECPIVGAAVKYEWLKNDMPVHEAALVDDTISFSKKKQKIIIRKLDYLDSGTYRCRGTNGFGSREYVFRLFVKANFSSSTNNGQQSSSSLSGGGGADRLPYFTQANVPSNYEVMVGSDLTLSCQAESPTGVPVYAWYKDGREVLSANAAVIELTRLQPSDSGFYRCKAEDLYGSIERTFEVNVIDPSFKEPRILPGNSNTPIRIATNAGETATLECKVQSAAGRPNIKWFRRIIDESILADRQSVYKNANMFEIIKGERYAILESSQNDMEILRDGTYVKRLILGNVTPKDAGPYTCLASNAYGLQTRDIVLLVSASTLSVNDHSNNDMADSIFAKTSSLPIIIGVPIAVCIALIGIVVYFVRRRKLRGSKRARMTAAMKRAGGIVVTGGNSSTTGTGTGYLPVHIGNHPGLLGQVPCTPKMMRPLLGNATPQLGAMANHFNVIAGGTYPNVEQTSIAGSHFSANHLLQLQQQQFNQQQFATIPTGANLNGSTGGTLTPNSSSNGAGSGNIGYSLPPQNQPPYQPPSSSSLYPPYHLRQ